MFGRLSAAQRKLFTMRVNRINLRKVFVSDLSALEDIAKGRLAATNVAQLLEITLWKIRELCYGQPTLL